MRRALQTAHGALRAEDGWPRIRLLPEARELKNSRLEKDCVSTPGNVGPKIAESAGLEGAARDRVDATACQAQWWTETYESEDDKKARVEECWERIMGGADDSGDGACIVVTHSNLIIALARLAAERMCTLTLDSGVEKSESGEWDFQVLPGLPNALARARSSKLRNCGVLGLRCKASSSAGAWTVEDALLLFGSSFEDFNELTEPD
jgi:hypothetical protein